MSLGTPDFTVLLGHKSSQGGAFVPRPLSYLNWESKPLDGALVFFRIGKGGQAPSGGPCVEPGGCPFVFVLTFILIIKDFESYI